MRIEEFDPNMKVPRIDLADAVWYDPKEAPFSIHGLYHPEKDGRFVRMDPEVAKATNGGVAWLNDNTAGGRIRFTTDSPYVAIHAEMSEFHKMDHMAFDGIFGFDLYCAKGNDPLAFIGTYRPPVDGDGGFESVIYLPGGEQHVEINMPLYNPVDRLLIALKDGSEIKAARPYSIEKPVVYYGSSITQGGCASRPGNSYQSIISRMLDCEYLNLGFAGSALGEPAIADYIAAMDMSLFVLDYDHNAPTVEHLRDTHEAFYKTVRAAHPDLPIIMVTRPEPAPNEDSDARAAVVRETYEHAVAAGDDRVSYLCGTDLVDGVMRDSCTVDRCHPNDLGFMRMAVGIGAEIESLLRKCGTIA